MVAGLVVAGLAQGADGTFARAWGKDVGGPGVNLCTVAANCQSGAFGALGGEFASPRYDDSSGTFLSAWGKDVGGPGVGLCTVAASCQVGTAGALGGEFNAVTAVATDGAGNVYTADFNNRRIDKFDSSGAFLRAWGKDVAGPGVGLCTVSADCQAASAGARGGEFSFPEGVAADTHRGHARPRGFGEQLLAIAEQHVILRHQLSSLTWR